MKRMRFRPFSVVTRFQDNRLSLVFMPTATIDTFRPSIGHFRGLASRNHASRHINGTDRRGGGGGGGQNSPMQAVAVTVLS